MDGFIFQNLLLLLQSILTVIFCQRRQLATENWSPYFHQSMVLHKDTIILPFDAMYSQCYWQHC
jgi:hypothetical protein